MTFLVWRPDRGETVDDARTYDAPNVSMAACRAAEYDHMNRNGWEWTWPVTYHVQKWRGAPVYAVDVERVCAPTFIAGKPSLA